MVELVSRDGIAENSPLRRLTEHEFEVLSLMAEAYANVKIAEALFIQPRTVERHINSLLDKLGIGPEDGQHVRIQAVLVFLKETGQICHGQGDLFQFP